MFCSEAVLLVVTEQIYCNLFISVRLREDLLTHHLPRLNTVHSAVQQYTVFILPLPESTRRNDQHLVTSISLHHSEIFWGLFVPERNILNSLHHTEMGQHNSLTRKILPRSKMQSFGNISIPGRQEIVNVPLWTVIHTIK